jgi:hypothetical protein
MILIWIRLIDNSQQSERWFHLGLSVSIEGLFESFVAAASCERGKINLLAAVLRLATWGAAALLCGSVLLFFFPSGRSSTYIDAYVSFQLNPVADVEVHF